VVGTACGLYHLLAGSSDCDAKSVANFFEELCETFSAAILEPAGIRCVAAIEDGTLPSGLRYRLALIVTELITNAASTLFPSAGTD
jgi:two-component sensor histidine kinase